MTHFFDIHTHANFKVYDEDRADVIGRALEGGVWHTNVGTDLNTSKDAVEVAKHYEEGVYATVGLHPVHTTDEADQFDVTAYRELAKHEKVVAIGECGLDYFRLEENTKKIQSELFEAQIDLANEIKKPLMIHVRSAQGKAVENVEAYRDTRDMLRSLAKVPFNIHFFAGDTEVAEGFLDLGGTLSFTGVVTFTSDYDDVVKYVPVDRVMSETDAPYVTPKPYRGKRNEPSYVQFVARRIAEIKGLTEEEMLPKLFSNACSFFGLNVSK